MAKSKTKKTKVKKAAVKTKKAGIKSLKKKSDAKKLVKKTIAIPTPKPVKPPTREPFKKEMTKRLQKVKKTLLTEVGEKIKSESNTLKFEIGDIYDIASNERERELTLMLGDREREKLAEIEEAFERLRTGTYGICEECGESITEARLTAMPFTRVCVECKSKDEKERGTRRRHEEEHGLAILEKTEAEEEEF